MVLTCNLISMHIWLTHSVMGLGLGQEPRPLHTTQIMGAGGKSSVWNMPNKGVLDPFFFLSGCLAIFWTLWILPRIIFLNIIKSYGTIFKCKKNCYTVAPEFGGCFRLPLLFQALLVTLHLWVTSDSRHNIVLVRFNKKQERKKILSSSSSFTSPSSSYSPSSFFFTTPESCGNSQVRDRTCTTAMTPDAAVTIPDP